MDARKNAFFLQENRHVHKIPRFRGVGYLGGGGGGSADFILTGAQIFLILYSGTKKRGFKQSVFLQSRASRQILGPAVHLALRAPRPREAYTSSKTPF